MKYFIVCIALIAALTGFAQTEASLSDREFTGSLLLRVYDGPTLGVNLERSTGKAAYIFYLGAIDVNIPGTAVFGKGVVTGLGLKYYFKENNRRWNIQNALEYGQYQFSQTNYTGTYRYLSFVNPQLGYKFKLGNFAIEPAVGFLWKIELKGIGDIDNNWIYTTKGKYGLNIGYVF